MAPVSHPTVLPDDAATGVEEQEWTAECNELLGQVLETQIEIASLLKTHDDTQQSLTSLKQQCDDEVSSLGIFAAPLWCCVAVTPCLCKHGYSSLIQRLLVRYKAAGTH
jgi:hypothetical protein